MDKNTKVGASISQANKRKAQMLHDISVELGASCESEDSDKKFINFDIKSMKDMGSYHYAQQELWDIQGAANVLIALGNLVSSEVSYNEPNHISQLSEVMRGIVKYIAEEINEMEASAKENSADSYAMMSAKSPAQVRDANEGETNTLNLSYVKSLGIEIPEDKLAVKYVSKNTIAHPVFIWGDSKKTDLEAEYFTRTSDFWDESLSGLERPLTWDHGQDKNFAKIDSNPVIGKTVKFFDDDIARWAESVITTDKQYRKYIDQFIEEKRLGYSSDSAPQYVIREKQGKATWLKAWPWFGGALTASPCEPRMKVYTPEFLKSLGIALPDTVQSETWTHEMAMLDFYKTKYT